MNNMIVKIFTLKNGLEEIQDVRVIRILSKEYNLLIMKDYMPIIGNINGTIEIETSTETKKIDNLFAYYVNRNNVFKLIVKESI